MFGFAVHGRCESGAQGGNGARALRMVTGGPEPSAVSGGTNRGVAVGFRNVPRSPHFPKQPGGKPMEALGRNARWETEMLCFPGTGSNGRLQRAARFHTNDRSV